MEIVDKHYSVLMSVYGREKAEYLRESMNSIYGQTVETDDFVLVCDGPLGEELECVIEEMTDKFGERLSVVRLAKNVGLGRALNAGIQHCRHELIARMDSDDISYPDRCERQIRLFEERPEISICSGTVEEFSTDPAVVDARRILPETQEEILKFARSRNPFNHPCVMYRKSAVEAAGGYQDFYMLEDYYLWLRMLMKGMKGYNCQEPLLHMRAGSEMYKRRSGWKYAKAQRNLFGFMRKSGFITRGSYAKSVLIRGGSSLAPNWLRKFLFEKVLRR